MSNNVVLEEAIREFKRSVEITRDVRFQANLRLSRRQRASSYIVSLLSLYVIALSLLPNIITLQTYQSQILLACSIVLSVFIIFTSLIDGAQNFFHQGELLHQCARKVASIHHGLRSLDVNADPVAAKSCLEEFEQRYRTALDECPINHDNVDYYRERATKPKLFPTYYGEKFSKWKMNYNYLLSMVLSYSWMALHIIAFIGITIVVYKYVLVGASPIQPPS